MKKTILAGLFAATASLGLVACGGSSSSDSSYNGTKTLNGTTFTCKSQAAFDSCTDSTTCAAAGCSSNASTPTPTTTVDPNAVITASCAITSTTVSVPATGCVGTLLGSEKTAVCLDKNSNSVRLLSGTGKTIADVTNATSGTVSVSGGSSFNGQTYKCV